MRVPFWYLASAQLGDPKTRRELLGSAGSLPVDRRPQKIARSVPFSGVSSLSRIVDGGIFSVAGLQLLCVGSELEDVNGRTAVRTDQLFLVIERIVPAVRYN